MLDLSGVGVAKAVGVGEAARVDRCVHRLGERHRHKSERARERERKSYQSKRGGESHRENYGESHRDNYQSSFHVNSLPFFHSPPTRLSNGTRRVTKSRVST